MCVASALMLQSCLNSDYDLTKDIDTRINVDGDFSAPLGNSELILADEFLDLGNAGEVLKTDSDGNYYLSVTGGGASSLISIPLMSFDKELVRGGGYRATVKKSEFGLPSSGVVPSVVFRKQFKASTTPLEVNEDVPSEVVDVKDVSASGTVTIALSSTAGKFSLSDLVLDFPDYLEFGDVKDAAVSFEHNGNVLTIGDRQVTTRPVTLTLDITGIDFREIPAGQGYVASEHKILIDDVITLREFGFSAVLSDLGSTVASVPESVSALIDISVSSLYVKEATVKVRPGINIAPVTVPVGSMPDFIRGDGVVLDLANPALLLDIDNDTPLAVELGADVVSHKGASTAKVHIGGDGKMTAPGCAETLFHISRTGDGAPGGAGKIVAPDLGDVVSSVPESIGVENISAEPADEYVVVRPGSDYRISYSYEVNAPLAFGENVHIVYSTDFNGWNDTFNPDDNDFSLNIADAVVTFDFANMLPLCMRLAADAIDVDGNVIRDIDVRLDGSIAPGSLERPSETSLTLTLKAGADAIRKLDGIRLDITGSDPGDFRGICINKNQGVQFRNMKLHLIGSMDIDL